MQRITLGLAALLALATPAHADFDDVLNAAREGDTARVIALLDAGDDPNPPEWHDSYVPLQFAAGNGYVEMTRALLAAGADTEYRDHNGDRPMVWAAQRGYPETVRLLLDAGSPADADDPYGRTAAMSAAESGRVDVLRLLVDAGADMGRREQTGMTVLHYAARLDDPAAVEMVLAAGGNPNVFEEVFLETPLHEAARWSDGANVPLLLAASAALEARTEEGRTPLFAAAMAGNRPVLEALLKAGADPDARDLGGATPILAAIELNSVTEGVQRPAIDELAAVTADIDRAFSAALWNNLPRAALTLFRRGASPNALDKDGRPALVATVRYPGLLAFRALVDAGADVGKYGAQTLIGAASVGHTAIMADLLARGIPIESRDEQGATALLRAAGSGQVEAVRALLAGGADPKAVDLQGKGAEAYMELLPNVYVALIDRRNASRAWQPTEHLDIELDSLRARHAEIRELLALD